MRTILLSPLLSIILLVIPMAVSAQSSESSETGLSGEFQIGAVLLQTDDQLSTDADDRHLKDIDGPADAYDVAEAVATIFLNYRFEGGTSVYLGNPFEVGETLSLKAGLSQPVGAGTIGIAATWKPSEEWENPYQTGSAREETDADIYGLSFEWQQIAAKPLSVEYNVNNTDIENDEIGKIEDDLKRNGLSHELKTNYTFSIKPGLNLSPELAYTYEDKEGTAESYHGASLGLTAQYAKPPWVFTGLASGFYNQYQKSHPLFNKTRQESGIAAYAQVMRMNLLGVKRLFGNLGVGYVWSDANINFFDSQTVFGLATLGINF